VGFCSSVLDREVDALVERAVDLGLTLLDTAPFCGSGHSETRLGKGLCKVLRGSSRLSSKVGRRFAPLETEEDAGYVDLDPFSPVYDYPASGIRRSFESSSERSVPDSIEIFHRHDPELHLDQATNEALPTLDSMRSEELITSIGIGRNLSEIGTLSERKTVLDVALVADRCTLLDQVGLDEFLPEALRREVSVVGAGVFNSSVLKNPVEGATCNDEPAPQHIIAKAQKPGDVIRSYEVSVAAVGFQFPLRHPAVKSILTDVRTVAELQINAEEFDTSIPDELWSDLESGGLMQPLD